MCPGMGVPMVKKVLHAPEDIVAQGLMNLSESYNDLYQWSVDNYQDFWEKFWHFAGIISSTPYTKVGRIIGIVV